MRKEGFPFVAGGAILTILVYFWLGFIPSIPFFIMTFLLLNFFRDPPRYPDSDDNMDVLAPADGKVFLKQDIEIQDELGLGLDELRGKKMKRIAIFMSPLDVHVNRAPISGDILSIKKHDGGFLRAFLEKSEKNSRVVWHIKDEHGNDFILVQIAGAIARRIKTFKRVGDSFKRGEKIGMIYFGSRVDLYIPENSDFTVNMGDKVLAGKTVVARVKFQKNQL